MCENVAGETKILLRVKRVLYARTGCRPHADTRIRTRVILACEFFRKQFQTPVLLGESMAMHKVARSNIRLHFT